VSIDRLVGTVVDMASYSKSSLLIIVAGAAAGGVLAIATGNNPFAILGLVAGVVLAAVNERLT
jgi:hypothetical protein